MPSIILRNVTIIRIDLEARNRIFRIRHFAVIDDNDVKTFIRISNLAEKREREISEIQRFQIGDIVDVDVNSVDWKIDDVSGTVYFYQAIRAS